MKKPLYPRLFVSLNQLGSDVLIAGTQAMTRCNMVRKPDFSADLLGDPPFQYRINRDWIQPGQALPPVNNCHEMVIDRHNRLFLLTDHPDNNIIIFDLQGKLLQHWTLNLKGAHGLSLTSHAGEENLWICDPYEGIVVRTTLEGNILQTLPDPHQLGIYSTRQPYAPTQTAIAPDGSIYVADGYGSQYVIHYDSRGQYLHHFGGKPTHHDVIDNENLDFAHGIAIDDRQGPGQERLLVTSRRQSCIKQFSLSGDYLGMIPLPGGFPCRPVIVEDRIYLGLCWSGAHLRPNSGFVVILDQDNRLCATLGGHAEQDDEGQLLKLVSDYRCFHHVHDVCVDHTGSIYACEWNAGKIYPVKLEKTG